jgi:hypothetical protein
MDEVLVGANITNKIMFKNDNVTNTHQMLNALRNDIAIEREIKIKDGKVVSNPYVNMHTQPK